MWVRPIWLGRKEWAVRKDGCVLVCLCLETSSSFSILTQITKQKCFFYYVECWFLFLFQSVVCSAALEWTVVFSSCTFHVDAHFCMNVISCGAQSSDRKANKTLRRGNNRFSCVCAFVWRKGGGRAGVTPCRIHSHGRPEPVRWHTKQNKYLQLWDTCY